MAKALLGRRCLRWAEGSSCSDSICRLGGPCLGHLGAGLSQGQVPAARLRCPPGARETVLVPEMPSCCPRCHPGAQDAALVPETPSWCPRRRPGTQDAVLVRLLCFLCSPASCTLISDPQAPCPRPHPRTKGREAKSKRPCHLLSPSSPGTWASGKLSVLTRTVSHGHLRGSQAMGRHLTNPHKGGFC